MKANAFEVKIGGSAGSNCFHSHAIRPRRAKQMQFSVYDPLEYHSPHFFSRQALTASDGEDKAGL